MAMKGSLSPSALGAFADCPRCFWLGKNGVKNYRGIMASLPNAIDAVLKDYHDEHRVRGLVPPEVAIQIPDVKPFPDLIKLNRWRSLGKGITGMVDGVPVMGLLDDLLLFEDGTAAPYDYKSNKSPRDPEYARTYYEHQGDLYAVLLAENGFKVREESYFSFWSPKSLSGSGDPATRTTQFPFDCTVHKIGASAQRARELVKRAVACLNGGLPEPGDECEMCAYVRVRGQRMTEIHQAAKVAVATQAQPAASAGA